MLREITIFVCLLLFLPFVTYANSIQLPQTGQTSSYAAGDDGAKRAGIPWPVPRFFANNNGTITDNLTGLVWLQKANCTETVGGISKLNGTLQWADALRWSNNLASGYCGLSDGSTAGQWRLPNVNELESLLDIERRNPALPAGHPFGEVPLENFYWSSSTGANHNAWSVGFIKGDVWLSYPKDRYLYVWPVRNGQ